ncbi:MAG: TatD family hydrolase [Candidatus Kerfeldbacteria bacterium]|nr:TatD family hydrolase [Candidatus Kerfeldbacteria bacterium]
MAQYDADRDAVICRALDQGIGLICVGTTLEDSRAGIRLAEQYPTQPVWAAVGVHPTDGDLDQVNPAELAAMLDHQKVVAIGESGLDFFRLAPDDVEARQLQADVLEQHLLLASQRQRPFIVHVRDRHGVFDAYDEVLTLLARHQFSRFVMHCYSGDWARAERFLELGGYLSFTGIVTFPKSEMMQEVARRAPIERIMIETDAPFLAPVPHRGQRNEPAHAPLVAEAIARLRAIPYQQVAEATTRAAEQFFGLKKTAV